METSKIVRDGIIVSCVMVIGIAVNGSTAYAANLYNATYTPIKEPECIQNVAGRFIAHDQAAGYFPSTPFNQYYLVARHMGTNSVSTPVTQSLGSVGGTPITNYTPTTPVSNWQRAKANGDANTVSGFQLNCAHAGSFINTWTFPYYAVVGGGAHTFYSYDFSTPANTYGASAGTDLVLQASVEIPYFAKWNSGTYGAGNGVSQLSLVTYLRDNASGQRIAFVLNMYDNRFSTYPASVQHDGGVPFISTPFRTTSYMTASPYSSLSTNATWTGLRFYRAHITQANFLSAINAINTFCASNRNKANCANNFSTNPASYKMAHFGALHEVFRNSQENVATGVHIHGMGAYLAN